MQQALKIAVGAARNRYKLNRMSLSSFTLAEYSCDDNSNLLSPDSSEKQKGQQRYLQIATKMAQIRYFVLFSLILLYVGPWQEVSALDDKVNTTDILKTLKVLQECMIDAVQTWYLPRNIAPKNTNELDAMCKRGFVALDCMKDRLRTRDNVMKRMIKTFTTERRRFLKKVCPPNMNSRYAATFLESTNCIFNYSKTDYRDNDLQFVIDMQSIEKKDGQFSSYKTHLHYVCCAGLAYIDKYTKMLKPQCLKYKPLVRDMLQSIIPATEVELICPDAEKYLEEICPSMAPLEKTQQPDLGVPPMLTAMYVILTMGS